MTLDKAVKIVASLLVQHGPYGHGQKEYGSLDPGNIGGYNSSDFTRASQVLYEKFRATHFALIWKEMNKGIANLILFSSPCFGACLHIGPIVANFDIRLGEENEHE